MNYLIDPTFSKGNTLFLLSFVNEEDRTSFPKYYTPKVELKDFNVIDSQTAKDKCSQNSSIIFSTESIKSSLRDYFF